MMKATPPDSMSDSTIQRPHGLSARHPAGGTTGKALGQQLGGDDTVIERVLLPVDLLVVLVSFAGDDNDVAGSCGLEGLGDGATSVGFDHEMTGATINAGDTVDHLLNDQLRVFSARIVRGHKHRLGRRTGRGTHEGPLGSITIATTAEHHNDPTRWPSQSSRFT